VIRRDGELSGVDHSRIGEARPQPVPWWRLRIDLTEKSEGWWLHEGKWQPISHDQTDFWVADENRAEEILDLLKKAAIHHGAHLVPHDPINEDIWIAG
jgi:hypothetical protein